MVQDNRSGEAVNTFEGTSYFLRRLLITSNAPSFWQL
jgi:hypothetical protein